MGSVVVMVFPRYDPNNKKWARCAPLGLKLFEKLKKNDARVTLSMISRVWRAG